MNEYCNWLLVWLTELIRVPRNYLWKSGPFFRRAPPIPNSFVGGAVRRLSRQTLARLPIWDGQNPLFNTYFGQIKRYLTCQFVMAKKPLSRHILAKSRGISLSLFTCSIYLSIFLTLCLSISLSPSLSLSIYLSNVTLINK